ncbi:hypothetical protein R5R35_010357 [Gryllus longicercus]|uniref:Odorant binding protein n=1 Tax=Gryllus longicercus TaxID=2509291 RepID=A0AAN9Z7T2_9ORTH
MAPAALAPSPAPLLPLLLLPLLLARTALPAAARKLSCFQHDIAPEVTNIPDGDEFELHAQVCMQEANVTEEEVHAAFEQDPNHVPQILKCLWGCMYRKIGLLVDGEVSEEVPAGVLEDRLHEYEALRSNCGEKVAAAPDECEKGSVLRDCAVEVTSTVTPPPS